MPRFQLPAKSLGRSGNLQSQHKQKTADCTMKSTKDTKKNVLVS